MKHILFTLLFCCLFLSACGKRQVSNELNEQDEDPTVDTNERPLLSPEFRGLEDLPLARISLTAGGSCTGVLIASDLVLTAGHCFDDISRDNNMEKVRASTVSVRLKNGKNESFNVKKSGPFFRNEVVLKDIGYVKLAKAVVNADIPTIATATNQISDSTELAFFGNTTGQWRRVKKDTWTPGQAYLGVPINSWKQWTLVSSVSDGKGSVSSGGNSGGPLLMKQDDEWLLVGIFQGDAYRDNANRLTFTRAEKALGSIEAYVPAGTVPKTTAIK